MSTSSQTLRRTPQAKHPGKHPVKLRKLLGKHTQRRNKAAAKNETQTKNLAHRSPTRAGVTILNTSGLPVQYVTRGLEFIALMTSLFWAVEATATAAAAVEMEKSTSQQTQNIAQVRQTSESSGSPGIHPGLGPGRQHVQRGPAQFRLPWVRDEMVSNWLVAKDSSQAPTQLSILKEKLQEKLLSDEAVYSGDNLSSAFKTNPLYSPTDMVLFRFGR